MTSSLAQLVFLQLSLTCLLHVLSHFPFVLRLLASKKSFTLLTFGILCVQLFFAALQLKEVGDVLLFSGAGWHLRHQIDFYFIDAQHTQYPFFPLLIFLHAVLNYVQEIFPIVTFSFYLKTILAICLLGISWLITTQGSESSVKKRQKVLQFLTNPITTLVIFFHGQVDIFLLLFFLLAVLIQQKKSVIYAALSMGLVTASIAAKTWSVLLLPWYVLQFKSWTARLATPGVVGFGLISLVFVYTRIVDGSSVRTVLPAVAAAGGPIGEWGFSYVFSAPDFWAKTGLLCVAAVVLVATTWLHRKNTSAWNALLLLVFAIQLVLPRWGIQYLFWVVPLLYLAPGLSGKQRTVLTAIASFYATTNYLNIAREIELQPIIFDKSLVKLLGVCTWIAVGISSWQLSRKIVESGR